MQTSSKKRAVVVGLFIFVGIVFLMAGIMMVGNLHSTFTRKIEVTALFEDVNGLQAGNNVWFSGVKVGIVKKLSLHGKSQVLVELKLNEKSQEFIRKDAKLKISTDGLIGNKIIVIEGGSTEAGQVEDGDSLGILDQVSTDQMMEMLQENNQNLLAITTDFKTVSQRIANGEGTVGKLIKDENLYNTLDATLSSLQRSSAHAEKLTRSVADFGNKLNQKGNLAHDLVTDTMVFRKITAAAGQVEIMTSKATEAADNLRQATGNLSKATDKLNDKDSPVGVLLNDSETAAHLKGTMKNLESGSEKLDEDLRAIQDNFLLRRYFKKKKKAEAKKKAGN